MGRGVTEGKQLTFFNREVGRLQGRVGWGEGGQGHLGLLWKRKSESLESRDQTEADLGSGLPLTPAVTFGPTLHLSEWQYPAVKGR